MSRHNEINGFVEISSEQRSKDTQFKSFVDPLEGDRKIQVSLGYRRCIDFDEGNHPGQDYAIARMSQGYIVGIVADGVSQSFYGNIAARQVSQWLLEILWKHRSDPPRQESLEKGLIRLEKQIANEIQDIPLPEHISEIMRTAMENTRKSGSQTVFTAFVVNPVGEVRLYQVGDVTAILHYPEREPEIIKAHPKGRWSTAGKSKLEMLVNDRANFSSIVIKSDGMSNDWGLTIGEDIIIKDAFEQIAEDLAGKDDISFIAVTQVNAFVASTEASTMPVPLHPESHSHAVTPAQATAPGLKRDSIIITPPPSSWTPTLNRPGRWRDALMLMIGIILGGILMLAYSRVKREWPARVRKAAQTAPGDVNRQTEIKGAEATPDQQATSPTLPIESATPPAHDQQQGLAQNSDNSGKGSEPPKPKADKPRPAKKRDAQPSDVRRKKNTSNNSAANNNKKSIKPVNTQQSGNDSNNPNVINKNRTDNAN